MTEEKQMITEEIDALKKTLTLKEQEFADRILAGARTIDAYRDVFDDSVGDDIRQLSASLRRSPKIQAYIDALQRSTAIRSIMTLDAIDQRLTDIAMTNVTDVVSVGETVYPTGPGGSESAPIQMVTIDDLENLTEAQRAAIKSVEPTPGGLKVKFHDQVKVMELLAKRRGGFVDKQEVKHSGKVQTVAYLGDNGRGPK